MESFPFSRRLTPSGVAPRGGWGAGEDAGRARDSAPLRLLAGGAESREEAQPLTDVSEGEPDFPRPAEDDGESFREEARESDREEFRFGSMDQGEPGSGRGGGRWEGAAGRRPAPGQA